MAETVSFNNPILTDAGVSTMRPAAIVLQVFPDPVVKVMLREWQNGAFVANGRALSVLYTGAQAQAVLQAVNTANFTNVSLRERMMERLVADGKLTNCTLV